jgi:hypothetical protein
MNDGPRRPIEAVSSVSPGVSLKYLTFLNEPDAERREKQP